MTNIQREPKTVLVTGGSGFIGNLLCRLLVSAGHNVINIDKRKTEIPGVHQYPFDIDNHQIKGVIQLTRPDTIIHLAASHEVSPSVADPAKYYSNNVSNTISLLNHAVAAGVKNFIFSSSSTVYGGAFGEATKEDEPLRPNNPYARSKAMIESILDDYSIAYGLNYVVLRYFNAAGADPENNCGYTQDPAKHLVPVAVKAALNGDTMPIYGTNYDTKDGTAERDYTHVYDISRAHINAMNYLEDGKDSNVFNLGCGQPYSVREVIGAVETVTGTKIATVDKEDRNGDVTRSWADISKARELLGWEPQFTLEDIIAHAVAWEKKPRR